MKNNISGKQESGVEGVGISELSSDVIKMIFVFEIDEIVQYNTFL
jgi:hypothetical protein